jgi:hypothetical protein
MTRTTSTALKKKSTSFYVSSYEGINIINTSLTIVKETNKNTFSYTDVRLKTSTQKNSTPPV